MSGKCINVTLPDGKKLELPDGSTPYSVAEAIGPGLAKSAIGGILDPSGEAQVIDLNAPLPGDCTLSLLTSTDDDPRSLSLLRHSTAHVMAEAICKLFPRTKLAYGPPLDDGFYYDIDCPQPISPDDFKAIEEEMQRIVDEDRKFTRYELDRSEAMSKLDALFKKR